MVATGGIAPSASCMSGRRSAAELRLRNGAPGRDLTGGLRLRTTALCRLSYWSELGMIGRDGRVCAGDLLHPMQARWPLRYVPIQMAGVVGLAPTSSTVTGWTLVSSNSRPTNWLPELESHQVLAHGQKYRFKGG